MLSECLKRFGWRQGRSWRPREQACGQPPAGGSLSPLARGLVMEAHILEMTAMSAPLEDVRPPHAPRRGPVDGNIRFGLAARQGRQPFTARRRAELGERLYHCHRRDRRRPQGWVMWHRRSSAGASHRRRHHAGSALGRLPPGGGGLRLSFLLVDPDPVPSRRRAGRLCDVFDEDARTEPRARPASSISRRALPRSLSSANWPKTRSTSWPTVMC